MQSLLLLAFLPAFLAPEGPAALQIAKPVISQMEDGVADTPGFEHTPGETLFFTCRIANYSKTAENKIRLAYSIEAVDPQGVPLAELYKNELTDEVGPQDKQWMPKLQTQIALPPLLASGTYKIVVKANDLVANKSTQLDVPFQVRGRNVAPSDTLVVRNFRFYREENDTQPMAKPDYRSGDGLWARFDIIGYKYGEKNRIDVSYRISILGAAGKVLWTQPEPAVEQSDSFYPKRYVPASMGLSLQGTSPGEYVMSVLVKDAVGDRTCETKQAFTVAPK
jgi:hypothetical protein